MDETLGRTWSLKMNKPLFEIARAQQGVITRSQILAIANRRGVDRRIDANWLVPMYPGVYCVASTPIGLLQRIIAVALVHPNALVDAHCALLLYGVLAAVTPNPQRIFPELVLPMHSQIRIAQVAARRQRSRDSSDSTLRHGVPVLSPSRLVIDMSARWPMGKVARALDALIRERIVTIDEVQRTHMRLKRRGRKGVHITDVLVEERLNGGFRRSNVSERKVWTILINAGFPPPVAQFEVLLPGGSRFIDLAYPQWKIAIEFDGYHYHSVRTDWASDQVRSNELVAAGWRVLRVTDETLLNPAKFLNQLRALAVSAA